MRHLAAPFLLTTALLGACGDSGPWSPSDPTKFDRTMINEDAISGLTPDDQAYVMGHAIGVYLMGKTLPGYMADHGFLYRPGWSSTRLASTTYRWEAVLKARSGGSDGSGGVIYDDVGLPTPEAYAEDYVLENPPAETGEPSDDVEVGEDPDSENGGDDPDGGDDPPEGDHGEECGVINRECAAFMNPAAFDARGLGNQVDPEKFAEPGVTGLELDRFVDVFRRGLADALTVEQQDDFTANSEVKYASDEVRERGYCEY